MTATKQDTGKFRLNIKDQFYTCEPVAKQCFHAIRRAIPTPQKSLWIEPSAGQGVFLKQLPKKWERIGLDIEPRGEHIVKADFLKWFPPEETAAKRIVLFGNPPFGRQSSTAKAFIKHGSKFADVIAFILPRSFVKPSMFNCFPREFHLIYSWDTPKNAFLLNGDNECDVPCVFQIWEKRDYNRVDDTAEKPDGFEYVDEGEYHIVFRRVGVNAGACHPYEPEKTYSKQSHHFIRLADKYLTSIDQIIEKINAHEFPTNTVGPRSLSKGEINCVLNRTLSAC